VASLVWVSLMFAVADKPDFDLKVWWHMPQLLIIILVIYSFINTFITFVEARSRYISSPLSLRREISIGVAAGRSGFEPWPFVQQADAPLSELLRTLLLLMYLLLLMLLFLWSPC
jgi:hypothetical protein